MGRRSVIVTNTKTDEVFTFLSQNQAAKYLSIFASTVGKYIEENLSSKGYTFTLFSPSSDRCAPAEKKVVAEKGYLLVLVILY